MDIRIDSLISFDTLRTDLKHVFSVVEKNGKVIFLKDNKPAYILMKYDTQAMEVDTVADKQISYCLVDKIYWLIPKNGYNLNICVDIFPRTENADKNPYRPIPENEKIVKHRPDINLMLSFHVETVVLMSKVEKWVCEKLSK